MAEKKGRGLVLEELSWAEGDKRMQKFTEELQELVEQHGIHVYIGVAMKVYLEGGNLNMHLNLGRVGTNALQEDAGRKLKKYIGDTEEMMIGILHLNGPDGKIDKKRYEDYLNGVGEFTRPEDPLPKNVQ